MSRSRKRKPRRTSKRSARPDLKSKGANTAPLDPSPAQLVSTAQGPQESRAAVAPQPAEAPLWRRSPALFSLALCFLAAQLWLPLSYYLSDYPWDERFSWRMFSTVRSLNCRAQAWEGVGAQDRRRAAPCPSGEGRCVQLRLSHELHMVWVNLLKRGRREVLNHFARERCAQRGRPLYLSLSCPAPEAPHPLITIQSPTRDLCAHPEALFSSREGGER